jgi:hypothetical protein
MRLLRTILHDLALAILVVAGVLACLVLRKALAIEDATTGTLAGFNTALATVNTPKSGTLSMLDDTIFQGRLTIDATNKVLIHEQNQLSTIDADIASLSGHIESTLTTLSGTATAGTGALNAFAGTANAAARSLNTGTDYFQAREPQFTAILGHVDDLTVNGNSSIVKFNALLDNPAIPKGISDAGDIIGSGKDIFATTDAVEKKLAQCTLHPTFKCSFKSEAIFGAQVGGYLLPK